MSEILVFGIIVIAALLGYTTGYFVRGYQDDRAFKAFLQQVSDEAQQAQLFLRD